MTKLRWDRAKRTETYSDQQAWNAAARTIAPKTPKRADTGKHQTNPPGTLPALHFQDRDARMTVAALLARGYPPEVVAARTGMKLDQVRAIQATTTR